MIITYTSMRPIPIGRFSSRDQNITIKKYCQYENINFSIPFPEFVYPYCFIQLFNIFGLAPSNSKIVFFSSTQFFDYPGNIKELVDSFRIKFDSISFASENFHIDLNQNFKELEKIIEELREPKNIKNLSK